MPMLIFLLVLALQHLPCYESFVFRQFAQLNQLASASKSSPVTNIKTDYFRSAKSDDEFTHGDVLSPVPPPATLEVVLFGIGDFRVTDHPGLASALTPHPVIDGERKNKVILPLTILETRDTLPNTPMARSHTLDTASILHSSLHSLSNQLRLKGMDLIIASSLYSSTYAQDEGIEDGVDGIQKMLKVMINSSLRAHTNFNFHEINVHVCNLGDVDNALGYGPYSHLFPFSALSPSNDDILVKFKAWDCNLRPVAWDDVTTSSEDFPEEYNDYENSYILNNKDSDDRTVADIAHAPSISVSESQLDGVQVVQLPQSLTEIPSELEITKMLYEAIHKGWRDDELEMIMSSLECNKNSGLYATHWGGLDKSTMEEETLKTAVDLFLFNSNLDNNGEIINGDEALLHYLPWWRSTNLKNNKKSLEHAAIRWMMSSDDSNLIDDRYNHLRTENLIEGELITRLLCAPLQFGTISLRWLWHQAEKKDVADKKSGVGTFLGLSVPSLLRKEKCASIIKTITEGKEWHRLFAAKNMKKEYNSDNNHSEKKSALLYGYWRWHGFLCRYCTSQISPHSLENIDSEKNKDGIVFIHGFGASGTQFEKVMAELSLCIGKDSSKPMIGLAPDLIGFGQSEKPAISYTQYLWESYSSCFLKEIVLGTKCCDSFVLGGNSIGGFISMSVSADDSIRKEIELEFVSASGAPGTEKCSGLILINSAGKILSESDVKDLQEIDHHTTAEKTALDLLGKCSPPKREFAAIGGTGLLTYLRPRIQSICKNLYPTNPSAVDQILCDAILRDSLDPGAINVMISGSKLPSPRTANELLGADYGSSKNRNGSVIIEGVYDGPVLVTQGVLDPLNDAKDRAIRLGEFRSDINIKFINGGHCPHDELPTDISKALSEWILTREVFK